LVRVKICGIRELQDALVAAGAGADFLGFVFVPGRRRQVAEERAREIIRALRERTGGPRAVGLFADQPAEEVNRIARLCGLDMVQLCGGESLDYCSGIEYPILKVLYVRDDLPREEAIASLEGQMVELKSLGHLVVLDRFEAGLRGGRGRPFDWSIAGELARRGHSFILAGGLTPENVGLAIRTARPWGVDVSSGVETGGVKDHDKIRAFIAAVRSAEAPCCGG
jgi:phosphoribosylanthranilate isomerase